MRGPPRISKRSGKKVPSGEPATARPFALPAPYGGWNSSGNLTDMPPLDAVVLDNFFPGVSDVAIRKGSTNHVTGITANAKSLLAYEGLSTKIFAVTDTAFYDVTTAGEVGASVATCTAARWSSVNFANAGGSFLVAVNGTDSLKVYNGTTWQTITDVSSPAITGVATSLLKRVISHKSRLWFVEKTSMNLWYLPVDAFAGTAEKFPVGGVFNLGGTITDICTWTLDAGNGADDYLAILSSKGEVAVYAGTDPASASTWSLVGVYYLAEPLGYRPMVKYGGDVLILTKTGLLPLSFYLQSAVVDRRLLLSDKIRGAFLAYAEAFGALENWQVLTFPNANMLIVNVPISTSQSQQFVMNLTTKAWCRFTNWEAFSFAEAAGQLYFSSTNRVMKAWSGTSDNGTPIQARGQQAYSTFGYRGQKEVCLIKPHINLDQSLSVSYYIDTDFREQGLGTQFTYASGSEGVWDISDWDAATWSGGEFPLLSSWLTAPGQLGYFHSMRLQVTTSTASFAWTATQFLFRPAGLI